MFPNSVRRVAHLDFGMLERCLLEHRVFLEILVVTDVRRGGGGEGEGPFDDR